MNITGMNDKLKKQCIEMIKTIEESCDCEDVYLCIVFLMRECFKSAVTSVGVNERTGYVKQLKGMLEDTTSYISNDFLVKLSLNPYNKEW